MNEMDTFQLINAYFEPMLTYSWQCVKFNEVISHNWTGLGILYSGKYLKRGLHC